MTVDEAQRDNRHSYVGGGPGAIVSGLVWLVAAMFLGRGLSAAFAALFIGGTLIFPLSILLCRRLFRRSAAMPNNPLGRAALESTIAMIGGLLAAWLFVGRAPELVLPLAAVAVGTHYFVFRTVYGDTLFWLLGALITGLGIAGVYGFVQPYAALMVAVGVVELALGALLTWRDFRPRRNR